MDVKIPIITRRGITSTKENMCMQTASNSNGKDSRFFITKTFFFFQHFHSQKLCELQEDEEELK